MKENRADALFYSFFPNFLISSLQNTPQSGPKAKRKKLCAYLSTVFVVKNLFIPISITCAVLVIALFNFYTSIVWRSSFRKLEMTFISRGSELFSFPIGLIVRFFLGVDV